MTQSASLLAHRLKAGMFAALVLGAAVIATSAVTASTAHAQADEGFYGALHGGAVFPENINSSKGSTAQLHLDPDTGWQLGGTYGYRFGNGFRGELAIDYLHADANGRYSETAIAGVPCGTLAAQPCLGPAVDGNFNSWSGFAMAYYDLNVGNNLHPYVGGGLGFLRTGLEAETTARMNNGTTSSFDIVDGHDTEFAYRLTAGVAYDISPTTKFDVGYTFTRSGRYAMDGRGSLIPAFDFDGRTQTHAVKAGLQFTF
ncbi:MAG: porin family protein [Rhodospirillaceae bacterium]|nr:porin family protein [Rhodospirillaceae bacterium]